MLAGKQWVFTLDLASGFWQVSLSREDRAKTAIATHSGLFQLFKVQVSCVGRVLLLLCLCARGTGYRMTRGTRHRMAGSLLYKAVRGHVL